jgi:L-aspartate oxidase
MPDNTLKVDVLIVGTGVAGLYCALNLSQNLNILIITKSTIRESNTYLAQGGISTALNQEDIPLFMKDTLKAGGYKNDVSAVEILCSEAADNINSLLAFGLPLDRSNDELAYTREGAHSVNRIVHCSDSTGKLVAEILIKEVNNRRNINILENTSLVDLLNKDGICLGGLAIKESSKPLLIYSKVVVLASGGIGALFKNTTNQSTISGDGLAIALKNAVKLKDLKYIQFHPTALYESDKNSRRFLISESVRGEGGKLYNSKGERFVDELLPRDAVAAAINKEIESSGVPYVLLDISFLSSSFIKHRFPLIYSECLKRGIDITKEPMPVSPSQHYFMGGISVDKYANTSMLNLYAVGETACTGVHGKNRLASNSLLEGLVFSKRAAVNINSRINEKDMRALVINELLRRSNKLNAEFFNY